MNTRVKSTLILIAVLIIGIAIGFELSEISVRYKFHRVDEFRAQQGFVRMFESIIKPDKDQLPVIDSILINYHKKLNDVSKSSMQQISSQMDSMVIDLNKVLKQDQRTHLKNEIERMKRFPPPPPPPQKM